MLGERNEKKGEFHMKASFNGISAVAYWYQNELHTAFPTLATRDQLEII